MTPIIDMHCHVLPETDDGPETMKETLAVLREAQNQGIRRMIVTPHFHPGRYAVAASHVLETLDMVRQRAAQEGLEIRLFPGQECYYYSGLVDELENGNVLTMAGTRYVLVEFESDALYITILQAVRELRQSGYRPIIAHYERYRCLYGKEDRLDDLRSSGAMLQMNFDRLLDKDTFFRKNQWRRYLKEGYVDFLGSDTHGMAHRPLHVRQALDWMEDSVSPEITDRVLFQNVCRLTEPNNVNWKVKAK